MGSNTSQFRASTLRQAYTYAWSGTRYRDLSTANASLIEEGLADGHDMDDFIALTVHLIEKTSRRIVRSQDLCIETPYTENLASSRADLWFHATLDKMEEEQAKSTVHVEVTVKDKEKPCQD